MADFYIIGGVFNAFVKVRGANGVAEISFTLVGPKLGYFNECRGAESRELVSTSVLMPYWSEWLVLGQCVASRLFASDWRRV